jgi:hypothetical protein
MPRLTLKTICNLWPIKLSIINENILVVTLCIDRRVRMPFIRLASGSSIKQGMIEYQNLILILPLSECQ